MKRCFIFGALDVDELLIKPAVGDLVIAADKGFLNTKKYGIVPDKVIGDFDSLGYVPENENNEILPVRKDDTDVGHAIEYALEKGFSDFIIYGALGGRVDHTFANFQLISNAARKGGMSVLVGNNCMAAAISGGKAVFSGAKGKISVFAVGGEARGVSEEGLSYSLRNATLSPFDPLGVSNEFDEKTASVSVCDGTLLIIWDDKTVPLFATLST